MVHHYTEIGDYLVFVMDLMDANGRHINMGDYLYLVRKSDSPDAPIRPDFPDIGNGNNDVPEPASILLWALGGLGLACTSRARNRRMKKLALS
jgi:hypothetical protein